MPPKTIARNVLPPAWLSFAIYLFSLLRVVGPDEAEPIELSTLGRGLVPGNAPISSAYAQAQAPPALLSTAYWPVGCRPRLKSGVSPMARAKFTSTE